MITQAYVGTMAGYNGEMNRRIYAAASTLSDDQRKAPRGLFWGSIHATLSHLLWADRMWMARFAGWPKPALGSKQSGEMNDDFDALWRERRDTDAALAAWAANCDVSGDLDWVSGTTGKTERQPKALLLAHVFNHQTHHRGQVHAALTASGLATGDTDLWLIMGELSGTGLQ
jgi:uncharacterized damage-inducible protein DinB